MKTKIASLIATALVAGIAHAANKYWAGGDANGFGYWNGEKSWATAAGAAGTVSWSAGDTAYFTNSTPVVIDLGGATVSAATLRRPSSLSTRCSVTISNGTMNLTAAVNRRDSVDSEFLKYVNLQIGDGCTIHNANDKNGFGFTHATHVVFGKGSSYIEDNSGYENEAEGRGPNHIGGNSNTYSNSVTVCEGASMTLKRKLVVGSTYSPNNSAAYPDMVGSFIVKGGTVNMAGNMCIGMNASGNNTQNTTGAGYYVQDGGNVTVGDAVMMGALYNDNYTIYNSKSSFTLNGGNFTCDYFDMNYQGNGQTLTLNDGTLWIKKGFMFKTETGKKQYVRQSKVYLNGGTLKIGGYMYTQDDDNTPTSSGGMWFNGTTIEPTGNFNTDDGSKTKNFIIQQGGLKINTAGGVTFGLYQQVTGGTGALVKQGNGQMYVNKRLLSTGGVVVEGGWLEFTATGDILSGGPLTVKSGGFWSGAATFSNAISLEGGSTFVTNRATMTLATGARLNFNNTTTNAKPVRVKALSVTAASVPVTFTASAAFNLDDAYPLIIGGVTESSLSKFAVSSVVANGMDITQGVYLAVESGNLVLRRKPFFFIKVR